MRRHRARLGALLLCACTAPPLAAQAPAPVLAPLPETLTIAAPSLAQPARRPLALGPRPFRLQAPCRR